MVAVLSSTCCLFQCLTTQMYRCLFFPLSLPLYKSLSAFIQYLYVVDYQCLWNHSIEISSSLSLCCAWALILRTFNRHLLQTHSPYVALTLRFLPPTSFWSLTGLMPYPLRWLKGSNPLIWCWESHSHAPSCRAATCIPQLRITILRKMIMVYSLWFYVLIE